MGRRSDLEKSGLDAINVAWFQHGILVYAILLNHEHA